MRRVLAVVLLALVVGACGGDEAGTNEATREIAVTMRDTRFAPDAISVVADETVRFVFANKGTVDHDAFIGDEKEQRAHGAAMTGANDHHHGDTGAITVQPGKTGELTHTFDEAGTFFVGCHEPGHWDAGMQLTITVIEKETNQ